MDANSETKSQQAHVLQNDAPPHSGPPSVLNGDVSRNQTEQAEVRRDVLRAEAMVRLAIGYTMHLVGIDRIDFVDSDLLTFADQHRVEVSTGDGISTYLIKSRNEERN